MCYCASRDFLTKVGEFCHVEWKTDSTMLAIMVCLFLFDFLATLWRAILAYHFVMLCSLVHTLKEEGETNVLNMVASPISEVGQIHLNSAAILFTPTLHFELQSASFLLKSTFILSSSTYIFTPYLASPSSFEPQNLIPF